MKINELKLLIAASDGNYRETLSVLADKSKENAHLKNDLSNLSHAKESLSDKMTHLEEKYKFINGEYMKAQEEVFKSQHAAKCADKEVAALRDQLRSSDEQARQASHEAKCKDELVSVLRGELQNASDKCRLKVDEACRMDAELQALTLKCMQLGEENKKLEACLEKSRDNGERLHKESEMVIANVNSWVHEQRQAITLTLHHHQKSQCE